MARKSSFRKKMNYRFKRKFMKKLMRNPLGKSIANNNRKVRLSFSFIIPASTAAAASIQLRSLTFPLNYPGMYRDYAGTRAAISAGSGTAAPQNYSQFFGTNGVFDQYKVQALRFKFMPAEVSTITSTTDYDTVDIPSIIYRFNDNDDDNLMVNEPNALNYGAAPKHFSDGRAIYYTFYQKKENRNRWMNVAGILNNPGSAGVAISEVGATAPAAGMKILFVINNGSATTTRFFGRVYVTWDVIFRGIATPVPPP